LRGFILKVAIYTSIVNKYDSIKLPIKQESYTGKVDYFCFTSEAGSNRYKISVPRLDLHPRLINRWYKLFPNEINELNNYDITIYIDGNLSITNPGFVDFCLNKLGNTDFALYKYHTRSCIYKEISECRKQKKFGVYDNHLVQELDYRRFYPANNGLYWCGCLIRRKSSINNLISLQWWNHIIKYTWRDQISFPVACYLNRFTPTVITEPVSNNIIVREHNRILR